MVHGTVRFSVHGTASSRFTPSMVRSTAQLSNQSSTVQFSVHSSRRGTVVGSRCSSRFTVQPWCTARCGSRFTAQHGSHGAAQFSWFRVGARPCFALQAPRGHAQSKLAAAPDACCFITPWGVAPSAHVCCVVRWLLWCVVVCCAVGGVVMVTLMSVGGCVGWSFRMVAWQACLQGAGRQNVNGASFLKLASPWTFQMCPWTPER